MSKTAPRPPKDKIKNPSSSNRLLLILLVLVGVGLLILIGYFVYARVLPQSNLAEHLPAEETVAVIEMDGLELPAKLSQNEFLVGLNNFMGLDIKPAVDGFGTGKVAYILLDTEGEANKPVVFIQAKTKAEALNYFKGLKLEGESLESSEDENKIYSFSQGQAYAFKFLDRYVAISPDKKVLEALKTEPAIKLSADATYQKTINNLPRNAWVMGYFNVKKLDLAQDLSIRSMIEPMKQVVHNFAFTVRKEEDGFQFNTFLNVNKDLLALSQGNPEEKFTHKFADYLPAENLALYVGGSNLAEEWQNTLETISNFNPSYGLIMEGLVRAQTKKLFGENVDLRNDLYPLFEGEYALMVGENEGQKEFELILAQDDAGFTQKKMEKMAQGFEAIAASFDPKISVVPLPDGTESRELVPDDTDLEKSTDKIEGYDVTCTEIGTKAAFCYAITSDFVIMTSSKELMEKSLKPGGNTNLATSESFKKATGNLSKVTDEITFLNPERLSKILGDQPYIQMIAPYLTQFDSATWVKQYFDDGVSTEGYVLLK